MHRCSVGMILTCLVGCRLTITTFPPLRFVSSGRSPLGLICKDVPRVSARSARLHANTRNKNQEKYDKIWVFPHSSDLPVTAQGVIPTCGCAWKSWWKTALFEYYLVRVGLWIHFSWFHVCKKKSIFFFKTKGKLIKILQELQVQNYLKMTVVFSWFEALHRFAVDEKKPEFKKRLF